MQAPPSSEGVILVIDVIRHFLFKACALPELCNRIHQPTMTGELDERIRNEVKRGEIHVVRALKESGEAVFDYISKDALFAIDGRILDADSKPTLREYMQKEWVPHATFEMKDVKVVPTGLMAATICYRASATKIFNENEPPQKSNFVCSSSWRQLASAEWEMVSHCEGRV